MRRALRPCHCAIRQCWSLSQSSSSSGQPAAHPEMTKQLISRKGPATHEYTIPARRRYEALLPRRHSRHSRRFSRCAQRTFTADPKALCAACVPFLGAGRRPARRSARGTIKAPTTGALVWPLHSSISAASSRRCVQLRSNAGSASVALMQSSV